MKRTLSFSSRVYEPPSDKSGPLFLRFKFQIYQALRASQVPWKGRLSSLLPLLFPFSMSAIVPTMARGLARRREQGLELHGHDGQQDTQYNIIWVKMETLSLIALISVLLGPIQSTFLDSVKVRRHLLTALQFGKSPLSHL